MTTARQRLLLVIFGLLLGAAVAFGAWQFTRPPQCVPEQLAMQVTGAIKFYKEPCDVFTWDLAEPGLPNHTVQFNNLGMNDEIVSFEKPPDTFRILVIGDSYAQGLQVPREQGFVDLVERRLNMQYRQHIEIINLSVDTIGTDRMLMLYALLGYRFDPDVVLLAAYVGNDIQNNSIEMARLRNEGYQPRPFFKIDTGGNLRLHNWSDETELPTDNHPAPAWLRRARTEQPYPVELPPVPGIISEIPYQLDYPVQLGLYLPEDAYWTEAWALTDALIEQFADLTAAANTPFGVIVIPDRRAVHVADYRATIEQYPFIGAFDPAAPRERVVQLADSHGIPTLDLLPVLFSAEVDGERAYLQFDGHFNANGHQLTAGAVEAWIIENEFIPQ